MNDGLRIVVAEISPQRKKGRNLENYGFQESAKIDETLLAFVWSRCSMFFELLPNKIQKEESFSTFGERDG